MGFWSRAVFTLNSVLRFVDRLGGMVGATRSVSKGRDDSFCVLATGALNAKNKQWGQLKAAEVPRYHLPWATEPGPATLSTMPATGGALHTFFAPRRCLQEPLLTSRVDAVAASDGQSRGIMSWGVKAHRQRKCIRLRSSAARSIMLASACMLRCSATSFLPLLSLCFR